MMRIVPLPFGLFRQDGYKRKKTLSSVLCIEAGIRGWDSIEFKELYMSACEYLGDDKVHKVQVRKDKPYLQQVKKALNEVQPSHYLYDPRTGSQNWWIGLWQAFNFAFLLHLRGVIPIALLTDWAIRRWRAQSAIVTAKRGVVISFASVREISPIYPHRRLIAPSLMPLSEATVLFLDTLFERRPDNPPIRALFTGLLYEPRITILHEIADNLKSRGFALEIRGREIGQPRIPDLEYWSRLSHERIILTTADQVESIDLDWRWIKQLTYRYLEVLASGALLVAPEVPGIRRYFVPGEHFVSFTTPDHASEVIEYYLTNEIERAKISKKGRERAKALVAAHSFWVGVDIGLGKNSLT
jgi:hypothetical protein